MRQTYFITYNGVSNADKDITISQRPDKPIRESIKNTYTIPGLGVFYKDLDYADNLEMPFVMHFNVNENEWMDKCREIEDWLTGSGTLIVSDDPTIFYKVKEVKLGTISRYLYTLGELEVVFVIDPYAYVSNGLTELNNPTMVFNKNRLHSYPTFKIDGSGSFTMFINDISITAIITKPLTIDVSRRLAYLEDGTNITSQINGSKIIDLVLKPGENDISITSGFDLKVIPNWRR